MGLDEDATRASSPRARGRRRSSSDAEKDTRALIVAAAGDEFAARGYDSASFRSIARTAGVDPALVHHYFSDKADLFAESISAPIRPDHILRSALSGPRDRIGENLVRLLLTAFEDQHSRDRLLAVLRTALGHEFAATMIRQFLFREVFRRIAVELAVDDGELRATLAASQLVGLIIARYGIRIEPLASTPVEELVRRIGPIVQWYLTGESALDSAGATGE